MKENKSELTSPAPEPVPTTPSYSGDIYAPSGPLLRQVSTLVIAAIKAGVPTTAAVRAWSGECERLGFRDEL